MIDPRKTVSAVLDADAPPDMRRLSGESERGLKKRCHSLGALRQDLVSVPVRFHHDIGDGMDVFIRHAVVKKVAHGIHEDHLARAPFQRFGQL